MPISENVQGELDLNWEDWKSDSPFYKHMIAGICAGITEHCVMYPFDTIKVYNFII